MRIALAALLLSLACAHVSASSRDPVFAPLPDNPAIHIRIVDRFYEVHGGSPREVRDEMNRQRPVGRSGPFDALTQWFVAWHYPHLQNGSGCRAGAPRIDVTITTTLPRWPEGESSEPWRRYFASLREHERGHAQNARSAGEAVFETLEKLPASPTCAELDATASREGKDVLKSFNAEDDAYDARTRHGIRQGAEFP